MEVMIFLIISSALLVSAVGLFGPRIANTQFNQSVQELVTRIRLVANQVSTGTYTDLTNFSCTVNAFGAPAVAAGTDTQGTRSDCIFVGNVMNFSVPTNIIATYVVMGGRLVKPANTSPQTLYEANPRLVSITPNVTDYYKLPNSMKVLGLYRVDAAGATTEVSALGFFQSFGNYGSNANLNSGSQNAVVGTLSTAALPVPVLPVAPASFTNINAVIRASPSADTSTTTNILLCVQGGNDKKAGIEIDTQSSSFAASITMDDARC